MPRSWGTLVPSFADKESGVSVLAALGVALIAWFVDGVAQRALVVVLAASAVALVAGAALGLALYPWTDLPVLGFALAGGVLIGRRLPPRAMPMLVLLAVLAALDVIQMALPGPGPVPGTAGGVRPASYFYAMLVIDIGSSHTAFGIVDALVIAAIVEHARRRALPFALGAAPAIVAFVAADVTVLALGPLNLPLIPFLLGGWLATEVALRIARVLASPGTNPPTR
jgi:hypothetical protein